MRSHQRVCHSPSAFRCELTHLAYDESTPVVVAEMGNKEAGEIFGVSNIKNGNRYETVHLRRMCIVLYPGKKVATAWISA